MHIGSICTRVYEHKHINTLRAFILAFALLYGVGIWNGVIQNFFFG